MAKGIPKTATYLKELASVRKPILNISELSLDKITQVKNTEEFYNNDLSGGLLHFFGAYQVRFLGANVFDNIWLIDRVRNFATNSDDGVRNANHGLIVYCERMSGILQIGDKTEDPPSNATYKITKFRNMVGYINDYTISRYPGWDPRSISNTTVEQNVQKQIMLEYGLGSTLFNVQNDYNSFEQVRIDNVRFERIFAQTKLNSESSAPLIIKTEVNSQKFMTMDSVLLINIEIVNVTNSRGSYLFSLLAKDTRIYVMKTKNVGKPFSILKKYDFFKVLNQIPVSNQIKGIIYFPFAQAIVTLYSPAFSSYITFEFNNNLLVYGSIFEDSETNEASILTQQQVAQLGNKLNPQMVTIIDSKFIGNKALGQGQGSIFNEASLYETNYTMKVTDCIFQKNDGYNGLIKFTTASQGGIIFENCKFINNTGVEARNFYVSNDYVKFFLVNNSTFSSEEALTQQQKDSLTKAEDPLGVQNMFKKASLIKLSAMVNSNVTITNCIAEKTVFSIQAGFLYLISQSKVIVKKSQFYQFSSMAGGVIRATQSSTVNLFDCIFENNRAEDQGGAFYISDYAELIGKKLTVRNNQAYEGGAFRFSGGAQFDISDSLFEANKALIRRSIGLILEVYPSRFYKTFFVSNSFINLSQNGSSAQTKGIEILGTQDTVKFVDCEFTDNEGYQQTSYIYINGGKDVRFENVIFQNNAERYRYHTTGAGSKYIDGLRGGFLHIVAESKVTIKSSQFLRGFASEGGAIFSLGQTTIIIDDSDFKNNIALVGGGVLKVISFSKIAISRSRFFENRSFLDNRDVIDVSNGDLGVDISKSLFSSQNASNFFLCDGITTLNITQTNFIVTQNSSTYQSSRLDSSCLVVQNVKHLSIIGSTFKNMYSRSDVSSSSGGALSVVSSKNNKDSTNTIKIQSSTFDTCRGVYGGAIHLDDVENVEISGKNDFRNNFATKSGGAIDFNCPTDKDYDPAQCSLKISDSKFQGNSAVLNGGAINWNIFEPSMTLQKSDFQNNKAGIYGDEISGIPQRLIKVQNLQSLPKRLLQVNSSTKVEKVQSGGSISMYFVLTDKYGKVVKSQNDCKLFISTIQYVNKQDTLQSGGKIATEFSSQIESDTQFSCTNGTFKVDNFVFVGQPNSTRKIKITTNAINYDAPSNKEYYNKTYAQQVNKMNNNSKGITSLQQSTAVDFSGDASQTFELQDDPQAVEIAFDIRSCQPGEQLLSSGKCQRCEKNTYLLLAPLDNEPQQCLDCPPATKAECDGGSEIYPKPGYWRSSSLSDNFMECRNQDSCLGRNGNQNNTMGACAPGYQGILCTDCALGYSRTGSSYKCALCPSKGDNAAKLFFTFIAMLAGIVFLVRSTLQGALEKKSFLSVYFRILMNHFQLLTLTASFDLDWPEQLKKFFTSTKPVAEATSQILSVDCFIDMRDNTTSKVTNNFDVDSVRIFYLKLVMYAITPLVIIIVSFIVWSCIFKIREIKRQRKVKILNASKNGIAIINPDSSSQNIATTQNNLQTQKEEANLTSQEEPVMDDEEISQMKIGRVISTIIVVLFLIHPTITTISFNAFNCQNIDRVNRLYDDLQIICYKGKHTLFALGVALPALIIWGLGIPCIAWLFIYQKRNELHLVNTKAKFGFLYNGYRIPQAYYWEIIIMYRKIFVIFIQVFLGQLGKIVQALTMLLFLVIIMAITSIKQPFASHPLNQLEALSLLSSAITVYCGLFYIAKASFKAEKSFTMTNEGEMFLFSVIVFANVLFLGYWALCFVQEMRSTIRKKTPQLYLNLFLCCRRKQLDLELQIEEYKERMTPFLNSIDKIQEYLNERKSIYLNGEVPMEDESFKKLLLQTVHYIEKVEITLEFAGADQEKSYTLQQLVQARDQKQKTSKIRGAQHSHNDKKGRILRDINEEQLIDIKLNDQIVAKDKLMKALDEENTYKQPDHLRHVLGFHRQNLHRANGPPTFETPDHKKTTFNLDIDPSDNSSSMLQEEDLENYEKDLQIGFDDMQPPQSPMSHMKDQEEPLTAHQAAKADVQIMKKKASSQQRLIDKQGLKRKQMLETMDKGLIKNYRNKIQRLIRNQKRNQEEIKGGGITEISVNQEQSYDANEETSRLPRNHVKGHMRLNEISQSSSKQSVIIDQKLSERKHTFGGDRDERIKLEEGLGTLEEEFKDILK